MPVGVVAFSAVCAMARRFIDAYLEEHPRPSFAEPTGKETLWDEDNWARKMDLDDIIYLVRPFILASENLEISTIQQSATLAIGNSASQRTIDSPPPYTTPSMPTNPEAWLSTRAYRIAVTTNELIEKLTVTAAGPTGSSARAWNLSVLAAVECGLKLLALYVETSTTLATAPPSTFLAAAWSEMRLHDAEMLATAQNHFKPVTLNTAYHLRLPEERRCLALRKPVAVKSKSKFMRRALKATAIMSASVAGPVGPIVVGGGLAARHCHKKNKQQEASEAAPQSVARAGEPYTKISFTRVFDEKGGADQSLCYDMCVYVVEHGGGGNGLRASTDYHMLARARVVHCEERHREQSKGQAVRVRERVLLAEEGTGKLLGRRRLAEEQWEVGFGISEDTLWVLNLPM
ncbi:hypothetical protein IQ07DRAFT_629912 [Pyrenochaeta sp. DS3sAY3a]|nr:hypothetical protein IQ07DRAFT_629912 [Pyrenochaeta sp. DS3sAY3a]